MASAVAINLTAVTPTGAGYATVYPFGSAQPLAASVNYAAGAIVNNALIVQIPTTSDFTIYTYAESHYVADIVGYFAPPQATELDCTHTTAQVSVVALIVTVEAPACPATYSMVSVGCTGSSGVSWRIAGFVYELFPIRS